MVKIEHYTVLRRQHRIVNGLLQVGLPRVLEYSFNSVSGRKFQFPVPVFQIIKQLLELYVNLALSPSSCDLRALRLNSLEIALQPIPGYSFLTCCY